MGGKVDLFLTARKVGAAFQKQLFLERRAAEH
jgi:hypothetical protein